MIYYLVLFLLIRSQILNIDVSIIINNLSVILFFI